MRPLIVSVKGFTGTQTQRAQMATMPPGRGDGRHGIRVSLLETAVSDVVTGLFPYTGRCDTSVFAATQFHQISALDQQFPPPNQEYSAS